MKSKCCFCGLTFQSVPSRFRHANKCDERLLTPKKKHHFRRKKKYPPSKFNVKGTATGRTNSQRPNHANRPKPKV